jgi:hypothetical protein
MKYEKMYEFIEECDKLINDRYSFNVKSVKELRTKKQDGVIRMIKRSMYLKVLESGTKVIHSRDLICFNNIADKYKNEFKATFEYDLNGIEVINVLLESDTDIILIAFLIEDVD